jgi:hypothetical protein
MKQKYGELQRGGDGQQWQYYIDSQFAWFPMYCQGTLCWLQRVWFTWPEKPDGSLVMASDVLSKEAMASMMGRDEEMYRVYFPRDPRNS